MRKTIHVSKMVDTFNKALDNPNVSKDTKRTLCTMVESLLMENDSYRGFQFNDYLDYGKSNTRPEDESYYNRTYYG